MMKMSFALPLAGKKDSFKGFPVFGRMAFALVGLALAPWAEAADYSSTLTGVEATDSANGYLVSASAGGSLGYAFGANDSITVWQTQAVDAYGLLT